MQFPFCFDDAHALVPVRYGKKRRKIELHIAIATYGTDARGGIVIRPEHEDPEQQKLFIGFSYLFAEKGEKVDFFASDPGSREILWRPPGIADLTGLINAALLSWDGQDLGTLRDDMTRIWIAEIFDRLATAYYIKEFRRFTGKPIDYKPYLWS